MRIRRASFAREVGRASERASDSRERARTVDGMSSRRRERRRVRRDGAGRAASVGDGGSNEG